MRRYVIGLVCAVLLTLEIPGAHAGEVTDQLKSDVATVFSTLEHGRAGLPAATDGMFEWAEMAHRVLGEQWTERTAAEREEFVGLFGGLVHAQIAALGTLRSDAIEYVGESVDHDRATVESRVVRGPGQEMRLDYVLLRRDGRWRVYDVVVNHASLLGHYRAQFRKILKTASYEALVAKLSAR